MRGVYFLCLVVIFHLQVKAEDTKESEVNWSTLSFLNSPNSNQDDDDLMAAESEQVQDRMDYADYIPERAQRPRRRRNRFRLRKRPQPAYYDYEQKFEDNVIMEREGQAVQGTDGYEADNIGYSAPSGTYSAPESPAGGYSSPSATYVAPSGADYKSPAYDEGSYAAPSFESPSYAGGAKDTFNDFLNALAAFLPIGLFLAAIPPNLIVINSARKRRDTVEENLIQVEEYPFMKKIGKLGYSGLQDSGCQKRLICEMGTLGATDQANSIQQTLNSISRLTPDLVADFIHAKVVFQAIRSGSCEQFRCSTAF